jgi:hypothetical protein
MIEQMGQFKQVADGLWLMAHSRWQRKEMTTAPLPMAISHPRVYPICCLLSDDWRPDYTQPVGLGNPAILHAPLAGPLGKSS